MSNNKYGSNILQLPHSQVYEPLYFGIGKNSACAEYAWYIQAKLEQLHQDGTIAELIHKHYPSLLPMPIGLEVEAKV